MIAPALMLLLHFGSPAQGGLTQHDLSTVVAAPPPGAAAPLGTTFVNDQGAHLTLGAAMGGRPTVLVFADYTCTYLCGPGLVLAAAALDRTGLKPDRDYSFVVVGINPRDGPAQARAMRAQRLGPGAGAAAQLLSEGRADRVAAALGYRYVYDARLGQYAHETTIYVLAPNGRVARMLPQFALTSASLSQALLHADQPPTRPLPAPLRFICYCLQPLTGAYDKPATLALRAGGVGFLAAAGLAGLALRRRRGRRP